MKTCVMLVNENHILLGSTLPADLAYPDNVVSLLRAYLIEKGETEPYLSVHQRLDQNMSGLLVVTHSKPANPSFAC
ncbi:hypothetical protein [Pajaroellobacter abortibovis]|uniref:hypothetical protein n=1 Tax=Pajaroellobacter abortibovis TaxID=1882918 RepID=UPI0012EB95C5|nr:hypothetical protein [Pajaroellobacter abortibovis]